MQARFYTALQYGYARIAQRFYYIFKTYNHKQMHSFSHAQFTEKRKTNHSEKKSPF